MSYWHQMYRKPHNPRLEVKNGEARFESLMAKKLSEKDRQFAESLERQFGDGGTLSVKQIECLEEDFVPTERQFEAIAKNKYAKKAIATATEPPAFPAGSLCLIRANYNLVDNRKLHNQFGLVMENHATGLHASSTLLVNGEKVTLQDRCLKAAQRKKKKKN